jgi:hypothetical protein
MDCCNQYCTKDMERTPAVVLCPASASSAERDSDHLQIARGSRVFLERKDNFLNDRGTVYLGLPAFELDTSSF